MAITDDPVADLQQRVASLEAELKATLNQIQALHYFIGSKYQLDLAAHFGNIFSWYEAEKERRDNDRRINRLIGELRQFGYTVSKDETKQ